MLEKLNLFHLTSQITVSFYLSIGGSVLDKEASFQMLGLSLFLKLDWGSYINSIAKTASEKIRVLIRSIKFLLRLFFISINPYAALYLANPNKIKTIGKCKAFITVLWKVVVNRFI